MKKKQSYISRNLSHFVGFRNPLDHQGNFETLCAILASRTVAYSRETAGVQGGVQFSVHGGGCLSREDFIVPSVTCYADIPFEELSVVHCKKYGYFGLAFNKKSLAEKGARPVLYVPTFDGDHWGTNGRALLQDLTVVAKALNREDGKHRRLTEKRSRRVGSNPPDAEETIFAANSIFQKDLLSFVKPFPLEVEDEAIENVYMEREWRLFGNYVFKDDDVISVFVTEDFCSLLAERFPMFGKRLTVVRP
ncbi:abortive infection system antitoxin AbiGi family protein [Solimonas sp. K1W22B-7]|uniref:abortive infection system antitoxin AbiGi family protein n=1 Tax=Solimonas sp. K1W22B-7 TaxID=2303331 RepID=UPI0013C45C3D|nr:abortive infection system antitoxin AbiGi family protein [Solimonas sp. K1W22B-7]